MSRAADNIKPLDVRLGAWESTTVSDVTGMEIPPEVLAQMPPDQRARMEAAFKARAPQGPTKKVRQSCVTKESMDKLLTFKDTNPNSNCKRTVITSTSRQQDFHEECVAAGQKSSSDVHFEATDSTHVQGTVHSTVTSAGGAHPIHMNLTFNARWLGPDCTNLKN